MKPDRTTRPPRPMRRRLHDEEQAMELKELRDSTQNPGEREPGRYNKRPKEAQFKKGGAVCRDYGK